jgi:hypothetical protein
MRKMTRLGMLGLSVVAASSLVASPAGASPAAGTNADQFGARANAESLTISIAGTQLTGSKATADLNNDPTSAAEASMILTPAFAPEPLKAAASTANPSDVKAPETCTGNELEAIPGVGRLDITCPSVEATVNGLLPDDLVPGKPLITITVGDARAVSTYNRITGAKGKPEASASAVTIELGSVKLAERLGLANTKIEVAPGVEQCVLTGTPLETCVTVATAGTDADGNPFATSTSIALFKGLNGGIDLSTGGVTSGAAGALPAALPAATPDLPRTGGNPTVAIMGAGVLALAVLIRRVIISRA